MPYPAVKILDEHVACVAKFVLCAISFHDALNRRCVGVPVLHEPEIFIALAELGGKCADDVTAPSPAFQLRLPAFFQFPGLHVDRLSQSKRFEVASARDQKRAFKALAA